MIATNFDIQTMIDLLFWVNLSSLVLVIAYVYSHEAGGDKSIIRNIIIAKCVLAAAFLFMEYWENASHPYFLHIGNALIIAGGCAEARTIVALLGLQNSRTAAVVNWSGVLGMAAYCVAAWLQPDRSLRVAVHSFALFATIVGPAVKLTASKQPFKCIVGVSYLLYLLLLLPRGFFFLFNQEAASQTRSAILGIGYLAMVLLSTFNLPAFLLIMKEDADRRLREMARTDYLSGLCNRQYFLETASGLFGRHIREAAPCSVLFMDIDHFKKVNDTHGHAFGDLVIQRVAQVLKSVVRGYDLPSRFGGEEFVCFVNNVDREAALQMAERVRTIIMKYTFEEKPDFAFTLSVGVATGVPEANDSLTAFIERADDALYRAKESGRNRVVAHTREIADS